MEKLRITGGIPWRFAQELVKDGEGPARPLSESTLAQYLSTPQARAKCSALVGEECLPR